MNAGELPEFSTGKFNSVFENNVFGLKTDSSITKPFETNFGYHIVKRLSNTDKSSDKNEVDLLLGVKQKVQLDARINTVKEKFVKDITIKTGFKKSSAFSDVQLIKYADSILKNSALDAEKLMELAWTIPLRSDEIIKYEKKVN